MATSNGAPACEDRARSAGARHVYVVADLHDSFTLLEKQVLKPISEPTEMGSDPDLAAARGGLTRDELARALASYVRTILAGDSLPALEDVIGFYDQGGNPNAQLDPLIPPLLLSAVERRALVAFLGSLSGRVTERAQAVALPR